MGAGRKWRVHRAGAPSLDHRREGISSYTGATRTRLQRDLSTPPLLVAYHPVTLAPDTLAEADALFAALEALPDDMLFCYPNADAGSRALIERTKAFLASRGAAPYSQTLTPSPHWSLLAQVKMLIGNSSSGIMETASFQLPRSMLACATRPRTRQECVGRCGRQELHPEKQSTSQEQPNSANRLRAWRTPMVTATLPKRLCKC